MGKLDEFKGKLDFDKDGDVDKADFLETHEGKIAIAVTVIFVVLVVSMIF